MTTCDYCGESRPAGEIDWPWNHWIRTGHHTTDSPPVDEAERDQADTGDTDRQEVDR